MSDSLQPHGLQHARPPSPSPTPRIDSNSCPLSWWCHPTTSASLVPFSCLQSFPASGSFQMSQFFISGGQSIGVSASASVLPMNTQDWSPLGWTGWISLQSKGFSRVFSNTTVQEASILGCPAFFIVQLSHRYMTTGKILTSQTFVGKVMSLLFKSDKPINFLSFFFFVYLRENFYWKCPLNGWWGLDNIVSIKESSLASILNYPCLAFFPPSEIMSLFKKMT